MSDKPASQAAMAALYTGYHPTRVPFNGTNYQQFNGQGMNVPGQAPVGTMQNMKSSVPITAPGNPELNNVNRAGYNTPMMLLPSGQAVPLTAFYGQHQASSPETANQLPYGSVPAGMFPGFAGNNTLASGLPAYNWSYGLPADTNNVEAFRHGSWSSNDENVYAHCGVASSIPEWQLAAMSKAPGHHYFAGPIQAMKTHDNKAYEMVNLDELTQRDPAIPRAVPALWTNQEDLSLAKSLQNPEGITNVYIRGFMPDTTDEDLERWASRFGEIESCKAIIEQDNGKCKGFGFVMYYSPAAAENCIRGFFHLGFQASYAQKSRNSRLKDLEDKTSTNIYCTGVPIDWNESDLSKHFHPYHAVSTKICRDTPSGVSKEVGFARFESREVAERIIKDFHSALVEHDGVKLCLRFADTKAQKLLKQQSQERRNWRSREYSYSVEHTPSPMMARAHDVGTGISPTESYVSPAVASNAFTPASSVSPPKVSFKSGSVVANGTWPLKGGLQSITNSSNLRTPISLVSVAAPFVKASVKSTNVGRQAKTPSPKKVTIKVEPANGKENATVSPRSLA